MVRVLVELGQVTRANPVFALGQKNRVQVRYFSGRVRKF